MGEFDQVPFPAASGFGAAEFADNPEPRCPCVLLLDTSGSMSGARIAALNVGLQGFRQELVDDTLAAKRVEVAVVTFGPVELVSDFQTADSFVLKDLQARGDTPMGAAIEKAIELVESRKQSYRKNGVSYYRPWIFLITDGGPTDQWQTAASKVHAAEAGKALTFYAVGVEGANFDVLRRIATREPLKLVGLRFGELFAWLSSSLSGVSRSKPGDAVQLANPVAPNGWATTA